MVDTALRARGANAELDSVARGKDLGKVGTVRYRIASDHLAGSKRHVDGYVFELKIMQQLPNLSSKGLWPLVCLKHLTFSIKKHTYIW